MKKFVDYPETTKILLILIGCALLGFLAFLFGFFTGQPGYPLGWLLGGVLGAGTVVCAFLVGPVAQLCFPLSRKLCSAALARAGIEPESDTVTENT